MRDYFCGWYFKCQSDKQTLAVIPAVHVSGDRRSCSIQVITDEGAFNIDFPYEYFQQQKDKFCIRVGENYFAEDGMCLEIDTPDFYINGSVEFGKLFPIKYDIMGPFKFIPFMECRHSVVSMRHTVNGEICVDGVKYSFNDAVGYIEGDLGLSFPKHYAWTQTCFDGGSLMLSVADIPFCGFYFTGVIGVILFNGKEYRLATYLGAKVQKNEAGEIVICQGSSELLVKLIKKNAHPLNAPVNGDMHRIIHESASCVAYYEFKRKGQTLFAFETDRASFEYEY